jgi:putative Mg2+ transporter-C (MgtC) family protein
MLAWASNTIGQGILPEPQHVVRIIVAVLLGGLIGLERELRDKPAGFRTITLISLGACVFTIISQVMGGPDLNSTRIAAQVVTGIGFLGAGAILRDRRTVYGITTAATIWAVAAIGMAAGFGQMGIAALGTVVILLALFLFEFVEDWIGRWRDVQEYHVVANNTEDAIERITALFTAVNLNPKRRSCYEEGASIIFRITAMGAKPDHERLRVQLARSEEYRLRPE